MLRDLRSDLGMAGFFLTVAFDVFGGGIPKNRRTGERTENRRQ